MLFNQDRNAMRDVFFSAWQKAIDKIMLSPLESQIVDVISHHPEYHFIFNDKEKYASKDFFPELGESNPFLHLSAHLSLEEQLSTERPKGINKILKKLSKKQTVHDAKHQMMEVLMQALWQASVSQKAPDENDYLNALQKLL